MAINEQYDDVLLALKSDNEKARVVARNNALRTFDNIMINAHFLDSSFKKRESNMHNTTFAFDDVFLKQAQLNNYDDIVNHTNYKVTPNNRFTKTTFLNLFGGDKEYPKLVLKCAEDDKGLSDEEYLEQQMKNYKSLCMQMSDLVRAISIMTYLLNRDDPPQCQDAMREFQLFVQQMFGVHLRFNTDNGRLTFIGSPTDECILQLPFTTEESQLVYATQFESLLDTIQSS